MIKHNNKNIFILDELEDLNYFNSQKAKLKAEVSALQAWNKISTYPQPLLKIAFKIRDGISALFGVKKIGGFSGIAVEHAAIGDYLDFFLVEYIDARTLVLTERDRHLDVMTCISINDKEITITASVKTHNWFGDLYMIPVGIAHKWIVKSMLKRVQNGLI